MMDWPTVKLPEEAEQLLQYLRNIAELRATNFKNFAAGANDEILQGIEQYVLDNGRFWTLPKAPSDLIMLERHCFDNAFRLVRSRQKTLRYVEGFASRFIAVHHAWCVTADGTVVDPTWEEPGSAYFGVTFPLSQVRAARKGADNASVLLDWPHGYPLLKVAI